MDISYKYLLIIKLHINILLLFFSFKLSWCFFFTCSDFISTIGLDINYCNLICEVCDCVKSVTPLYLISKRLPTWRLNSIRSSVYSVIPPSNELIWFSMRSSNKWADNVTGNFNSLHNNIVFWIWIQVFSIRLSSTFYVLIQRYTLSISFNNDFFISYQTYLFICYQNFIHFNNFFFNTFNYFDIMFH